MERPTIEIYKSRPNKTSGSAHFDDAGIDIYTPDDYEQKIINPGETFTIETGLHFNVPQHHMLKICNKTGTAKRGIQFAAEVVDAGFTGELTLCLRNLGKDPYVINPGEKIVQGVLLPIIQGPVCREVSSVEEFTDLDKKSSRGAGKFGSTGLS